MKDVGYTDEGNRLVEMSRREHEEFSLLCRTVEGRDFPSVIEDRGYFQQGFDLTRTFDVIRAYYTTGFHIAQFQNLLDSMKKSLDNQKE